MPIKAANTAQGVATMIALRTREGDFLSVAIAFTSLVVPRCPDHGEKDVKANR